MWKEIIKLQWNLNLMFKPQHVYKQEPITWSEQLPCAHATAFSQTSLFLDQFSHEFWLHVSNKPYKSISKNWRLKNVFLMFWQMWVFALSFWCRYFHTIDGHKIIWKGASVLMRKVLQTDAKNKLICKNTVAWAKHESCMLQVMGSWQAQI